MSETGASSGFESGDLAALIVDALIDANIVAPENLERATAIVAEEIDVRVALGNVELK